MSHPIKAPKKLIEVALPLDDINREAAREKSIRHGHPSTLHLWWARRPLAAARAVIFAQLVNDPSWVWELEHPGETPPGYLKASWASRRKRLFTLIAELVKWQNTDNEELLEKARAEIRRSWRETCEVNADHPDAATLFDPNNMPSLHDPFAGGGTIPLEAQRLGLEAIASDLNPVAVLINKAMIEIPPRFAGQAPVGPLLKGKKQRMVVEHWPGATGLAEDVRRYGAWMRDEAFKRIGHLYPKVEITNAMVAERPDLKPYQGRKLTVIAWLWARTVKSPVPAFSHVEVPLASSFVLAKKKGKEAWVEPVVGDNDYYFEIHRSKPEPEANQGTKASARGSDFLCVMSGAPISGDYIKEEGQAGRMSQRMMAVVCEGDRERVYLSPTPEMEAVAASAEPDWRPDVELFQQALGFRVGNYGMTRWSDLFTNRQMVALSTFCDLVGEARTQMREQAVAAGLTDDDVPLREGGSEATAYADAVAVYLALGIDRSSDFWSSLCTWANQPKNEVVAHVFTRHALPMIWDFAEASPFSTSGGNFLGNLKYVAKAIVKLPARGIGSTRQADAQSQSESKDRFVSTDPPYYDNIGYADLSDYFYVWTRKSLRNVYPKLFATMAVPKGEELVATPFRHGGRRSAEAFFLDGMTHAIARLAAHSHAGAPVTIYYAFKQSETNNGSTSSTGWETFLDAVFEAGFAVTGTWPIRTERSSRSRGIGSNALASSIVLVCRKRPDDAKIISRRRFQRKLNAALPVALDEMTMGTGEGRSPVAPVDLSQAMIGPGMAIFSRYAAVLEADGSKMPVRTALQLINRFLAEDDFDADTQFCLRWFEQHSWSDGQFGEADVLARAKATSVAGLDEAGVVVSGGGKVRLRRPAEYPIGWDPATDPRLPVWEALHQLVRAFRELGEQGAGTILAAVREKIEAIRQLAYRLYTICERRGLAEDARGYNELVTSWTAIEAAAAVVPEPGRQLNLFGDNA